MKPFFLAIFGISIFISFVSCIHARSVHRSLPKDIPTLKVSWEGDPKKYTLANYRLDEYPFFSLFDRTYLENHQLPKDAVTFRNKPDESVKSDKLLSLIDDLMKEIYAGKKTFTHFTILQNKDYNKRKKHGLIILKFNDYPFVLKLFLETPASFVDPFNKGLEPIFFFFLGNGINRHLSGFTRIKNREIVYNKIMESPHWSPHVSIPRKWFWVPPQSKWMEVAGLNMGAEKERHTTIPGTYCIIADFIDSDKKLSLINKEDTKKALDLCNYLDLWIDPHLINFMIEKDTGKFVIVDTEHFPSVVGLKDVIHFDNYADWYIHLACKAGKETYFQTKSERKQHAKPVVELQLPAPNARL